MSVPRVPRHIAVVMDGNGRWAQKRFLPRVAGHKQGVEAVRALIRGAAERGVEVLTVFAFSSENWQRPADEVSFLMDLFLRALREEVQKLHSNGIRFRVVGDTAVLSDETRALIAEGEVLTAGNRGLCVNVAVNYGGRWDIMQAVRKMVAQSKDLPLNFEEENFAQYLSMSYAPEPDLFIRTGGEYRISNFLLWQLAYTELYFTNTLWPDFDEHEFELAIQSYQQRERRFGRTSEQLQIVLSAEG